MQKTFEYISTRTITFTVEGDTSDIIGAKATVGPIETILTKEGVTLVDDDSISRTVCITQADILSRRARRGDKEAAKQLISVLAGQVTK